MAGSTHNIFKFWGKIESHKEAVELANGGAAAAFICAGITGALALASLAGFHLIPGLNHWALVDAAIFGALGFGTRKLSRICAVLALAFYLLNQINSSASVPSHMAVVVLMFIVFYVNGVRGTFAVHRLKKAPAPLASPGGPS